jgi:signal peptidase II
MTLKPKYQVLLILTPLLLVLDQWTKHLVLTRFSLGESIPIVSGILNLTYVRNTGAAFGILAQASPAFRIPFFLIVPVVALLVIGYVFRRIPAGNLRRAAALSAVVGGAIGNLIDRIRLGYVVDFLDFHWKYQHHFPAFNVADAAICVGVAVLIIELVLEEEEEVRDASPAH